MNFNQQECMKGYISEHGQLSGGYATEKNSTTLWNIHDMSFQGLPVFTMYVSFSIKYSSSKTQGKDRYTWDFRFWDCGIIGGLVATEFAFPRARSISVGGRQIQVLDHSVSFRFSPRTQTVFCTGHKPLMVFIPIWL